MDICNICGLPQDLCVCEKINTERRQVYVVERHVKGPMFVTTVNGVENEKEIGTLAKELKKTFACGGTIKEKTIILQGKHKKKVVQFLLSKGYSNDQIS